VGVVRGVLGRRSKAKTARPGDTAGPPPAGSPDPHPGDSTRAQDQPGSTPSPRDVPGVDADKPTEIPVAGWKQIVKRALREAKDDNVPLLAAGVAFFLFLALFPGLIAGITLYGLVADPAQVQQQITDLTRALPQESATLISQQLTDVTSGSERALGIGLVVSLLGALFSASGGVQNLMKAVNIAYDEQESRGLLKLRGTALLLTLGAILFLVVSVGLVAGVPVVLEQAGLGAVGRAVAQVLRWAGLVAFVLLALAVVYRYAPDRDNPRFSWVGIGSGVATGLWILGSAGFSLYVSNFGKYGETYGALAGVVVLLLWLFLTSYIILLGAEINSETEQQTAKDTTQGPEKPMGDRRAVKADSVASPSG
jgi:membrane protein